MNLREQILNAKDIPAESVDVPEWGVTVEVRGLDGNARAAWLEAAFDQETGKPNFKAASPALIIQCAYDPESGERVFEEADREILNTKAAVAVERIAKVALRLNGLDDEAGARGKAD